MEPGDNQAKPSHPERAATPGAPAPETSPSAIPAAPAQPSPRSRKGRGRLVVFGILFLIILAMALAYFFREADPYRSTDDAYVHGNQIFLTPRVIGTVVAINADDTDLVRRGEPLVILDDSDARVALQEAEAALGDTMRKVCQFYVNVAQAKADVDAHRVELARSRDDYRRRTAVQDGSVSVEDTTHAQQEEDEARDELLAAEQQLAAAQALVTGTDLRDHPAVLQAEANVLDADLALQRTAIDAPDSGYVVERRVQIGQRVTPGTPLLAIIPLHQIWVDANFKEEKLRNVRIGQPVALTSDFYGDSVKYEGRVVGLAPSTGAAFSLLPPDEGSGNWIKIVQRVPVRIVLDGKQLEKFPLRIGLSMKVVIDTRDRSGAVLTETPSTQAVYATDIYSNEWVDAGELVQSLVATNLQALSSLAGHAAAATVHADNASETTHE